MIYKCFFRYNIIHKSLAPFTQGEKFSLIEQVFFFSQKMKLIKTLIHYVRYHLDIHNYLSNLLPSTPRVGG